MAITLEGQRLTEAHQAAQSRIALVAARTIVQAWREVELSEFDRSVEAWLRQVVPLLRAQQMLSASTAAEYVRRFRAVEIGVDDGWRPPLVELAPTEQMTTSLFVTGPANARAQLAAGAPYDVAMDKAGAAAAGSATRLTLNAGRETVTRSVHDDSRAVGYARVTSGNPCSFCAMLASRGPVYTSRASAGAPEVTRFHDTCHCEVEPVYDRARWQWPATSQRYRDLWSESTRGLSGTEARAAFREALAEAAT